VVCRRAIAEAEALLLGDAANSADAALDLLEEAGADPEQVADFVVAVARPLQGATIISFQHHVRSGREAVVVRLVERGLAAQGDQRGLRWARLRLLERPKAPDDAGPVHSGRWLGFDPEAVAIARASGDEDDYASTVVAQDPRSLQEIRELLDRVDRWVTPRARMWGLGEVYLALLLWHGALGEALEVASRALAYSEEVGSLLGQLDAVSARSSALERLGEFDAAVADARRADELLARLTFGDPTARPPKLSKETRTRHWQRIDWVAFGRFYRDSALDSGGSPSLDGLMDAALAAYSFAQGGEAAEARRLLGWVLPAILASEPTRMKQNGAVCFAGWAVWELGDATPAAALRRAAVDVIAAGVGDCWWTSNELTVAHMSSLLGEFAEAEGWFERARVALEASGQRPLRAVVDLDEARHRLRHRLPGAGPLLAAARRRFDELGMPGWLERVDRLAADGGVGHPDGLTAREVEVLRLLAGGHTNAEIAATLVISVHTVERHLANAYRKIGARNRAEAAAYTQGAAL
jgi:DNA-binding CsgD family transcriptional regulator